MAQEKISFNNSLMSLPLATDKGLLWQCSCDGIVQSWDIDNRALIRVPKGWQPGLFFFRKADVDSAKFTVRIYEHRSGALVATYPSASLDAKVFRRPATLPNGQSWDTVTMPAGPSDTVSLNTGVYYLTAAGLVSEPFQVIDYEADQPPHGELLFSLGNTYNLSEVPYKTGYQQIFGLPGVLCAGEPKDYTESEKSERYGERISYQRQYRVWTIELPSIGQPLAGLLKSLEGHDTVSISDRNRTLLIEPGRIAVTIKEDDCCSLSATLTIDETISEWGTCKSDPELVEQTLTGAGPDYVDPADADTEADPYAPDPATDPTYEAPNTFPVAGTLVNEIIDIKECNEGWDKDGIRYRRKTILVRADGSGGTVEEIVYSDVCDYNPLDLLLPRIKSALDAIRGRVGQPLNLPVIDPSQFAPADGQSAAPVITAKSLPPGLTYSNGRISGTPTVAGNSVALLAVTQPGGASILVEVPVSTAPAAPSVLDVSLSVDTSYDGEQKELSVTVTSPFEPEVNLLIPNGTGAWGLGVAAGAADTWRVALPVNAEGKGKLAVRRAGSTGNGIVFSVLIATSPTTPGGSVGTPSLAKVTKEGGAVTDVAIKLGGLVFDQQLPPSVSDLDEILAVYNASAGGVTNWNVVRVSLSALISRLIAGGLETGNGSGSSGLAEEDIEKLAKYGYLYDVYLEGNGPKPVYPTLSGGTGGGTTPGTSTAVINANLSKYEEGYGLTIQANCSNGENFWGQVAAKSGGARVPDAAWHQLSRIDGTATNGTYAFAYPDLPTGGILDAGTYQANVRIGVDNATIVGREIIVASTVPVPLNGTVNFRLTGNTGPIEGVSGEIYVLQRKWSDGSWRSYLIPAGSAVYQTGAPAGSAAFGAENDANGNPTGRAVLYLAEDSITADVNITLIVYIGFNIELPVTIKNQNPAAAVKKINFVLSEDVAGVGRVGRANVTVPVQAVRQFYLVQNGVDAFVGVSDLKDAALKGGNYDPSGASVEVIWGAFPYNTAGTYKVIEVWRPAGVTQEPSDPNDVDAFARNPAYSVVVGATQPGPGTSQPGPWRYGTQQPDVLAIDYQWFKRTSPQRPDLYLSFKLSTIDQYEIAVQVTSGGSSLPKSDYTALESGNYGNGYTGFTTYGNAVTGSIYKLYIRKAGTTTDLLVIDTPAMPAVDQPRTNFYTKP